MDFYSEQIGGYVDFGLKMTPAKTEMFINSVMRIEVTKNRDAIHAARKTLATTFLLFGYDDEWVRNELLKVFDETVKKFKKS